MADHRFHLDDTERQDAMERMLRLSNSLLSSSTNDPLEEVVLDFLKEFPLIEEALLCLHKNSFNTLPSPDPELSWICEICRKTAILDNGRYTCNLEKEGRFQLFPIHCENRFFGYLLIRQRPTDFDISLCLSNLAATIGATLHHRRIKEDLEKTIQTVNRAQKVAHVGHWELDLIRNGLYWSDEVYRIFGLEPQEFGATYEAFLEHVHPDDREKVNEAYTTSVQEKRSYNIVHRVARKNGDIRYVEERCVHEFDESGNIVRSIGTVHDITGEVLAENYRKRNEKSKDLLLSLNRDASRLTEKELCDRSLDIAVEITDSTIGYLHMVNQDQKTISLVAWNQEALKGCTADHDAHYPLEQAGIWADCVRQRKTVIHNDYPHYPERRGMPEGHFKVTRHMSTPVGDHDSIRMIIGVGNKTEPYDDDDARQLQFVADEVQRFIMRKRAEEKLASLNLELEERVKREVQQRLQQEQMLVQKSRMAAMGEMIGAIAHQWKQPLSELSMLVQDIPDAYKYGELNEEYLNRSVREALDSIQFLTQTIDDFRNFFKPTKEKESFLACEAVNDIYRLLGVQFKKNRIKLLIDEHEHFYALGYPNEFKQVLLNIFNNAREVIEERKIVDGTIRVSFENDETTGTIRIRDNGGGIVPELLPEKIFEPYITTKEERGTGIGLQISRTIVESHMNGKITARNVENGAEFTIQLPISKKFG